MQLPKPIKIIKRKTETNNYKWRLAPTNYNNTNKQLRRFAIIQKYIKKNLANILKFHFPKNLGNDEIKIYEK